VVTVLYLVCCIYLIIYVFLSFFFTTVNAQSPGNNCQFACCRNVVCVQKVLLHFVLCVYVLHFVLSARCNLIQGTCGKVALGLCQLSVSTLC